MIRKKILIWHWGRRGGGPRYTLELVRALVDLGDFEIHLSLSRQSEIFNAFEQLSLPSCHVDTYNNLGGAIISSLKLPMIRKRFWEYVEHNHIDLIICTMSHLWNMPVLIGRCNPTPYLMVLHDALPHPGDDVIFRHALLKREISCADGVLALTEHVRSVLCNTYTYPHERTWVVPHGIFSYVADEVHKKPGNAVRLLFFGRILPYKGLDLLLDAYAMLRLEGLHTELYICGGGDLQPYIKKIKALEDITINNRWIVESEIGAIFGQADISVSPYKEASQSGVITTAYAAGVPVVVTPIGGLVEQVIHEQTGLIASAATAEALAAMLRRLISDSALRAQCAEGAKRHAQGQLSWPAIARSFTAAAKEMLAISSKREAA